MSGVRLVTTSVSSLPPDKVAEYNIRVVPVPFSLDGRTYLDGVDLPASRVYELMAYKLPFRTSSPPPADYIAAFSELGRTARDILCLVVSSKISMMYSSAVAAAQRLPDLNIAVIDTGTAAGGQALIDISVARSIQQGATLKECVRLVERLKSRVPLYGIISDPRYLARTGRVPSLLPWTASVIGIKPVISIREGSARLVKITRTTLAGLNYMLALMRERVEGHHPSVIIQHANAAADADYVKQRVTEEMSPAEVYVAEFSPVIGYATGPGTVALSFTTGD